MIPLYKHIIQPIEASFLQAYDGEGHTVVEKNTIVCLDNDYIATVPVFVSDNIVTFKNGSNPGVGELRVLRCIDNDRQLGFPTIRVGERIKVNNACFIAKLNGTYEGNQTATLIKQMDAGEEYVAKESFRIVVLALSKGFSIDLTYEDNEVKVPYFALLINKDEDRQKVQLPSHIHTIDDSKPESNDNALVYFEVGEADLHDFNEGDKLIFEIYRYDRKGYWTSKSPAFKVFETSIDDTATISLQEGGKDE